MYSNRLHGYHIQYNVVSRETLIDAQNILKHRDLIVQRQETGILQCTHQSNTRRYTQ